MILDYDKWFLEVESFDYLYLLFLPQTWLVQRKGLLAMMLGSRSPAKSNTIQLTEKKNGPYNVMSLSLCCFIPQMTLKERKSVAGFQIWLPELQSNVCRYWNHRRQTIHKVKSEVTEDP